MASRGPVVEILDDDDDGTPAADTPLALRKRSHGSAAAAAPDFLDAFSPSPPLLKRWQHASTIVLDDTPSPPKRRPSVAADRSGSVVGDTPRSFVPCFVGSRAVAAGTPNSILQSTSHAAAASGTPGSAVPRSVGSDIVVPETPGFTSPRLAGPSAVRGSPSPATSRKLSGLSCPISLDSDDEFDDTIYKEPLTKSPSNMAKSEHVIPLTTISCANRVDIATGTDQKDCSKSYFGHQTAISACKNDGTTSYDQPLHVHPPCEDFALKESDHFVPIEERKKKRQEDKRQKKEEKTRLAEERKQKRLEIKMKKEAMKAEQAKIKKLDKEKKRWESGKFATKSIVVEIDSSIIESGPVGGHIAQKLKEKEVSLRVTSNSVRGSILWRMEIPDEFSQDQASSSEVPYILFVLQAEEFCDLVNGATFFDHVQKVRSQYPAFTICYVINKLMSYIKKGENSRYMNQPNSNSWKRPAVEEALCKLATHYDRVHSRQCTDEAEVAEHVVGLTFSLANCKFRKPLTWLSVHANGSIVPKGIHRDRIKKSTWLKSLVAIPKVNPAHAIAIHEKYPTMRSLLNVYMDDNKSVHEKEHLLEDLMLEGPLGDLNRRLGPACSKQVYRILTAQNGAAKVDADRRGA